MNSKMQTIPLSVVPFLQSRVLRCIAVSFSVEGIICCDSNNWNLRNFTEVAGLCIFMGFVYHSVAHMTSVYQDNKGVVLFTLVKARCF